MTNEQILEKLHKFANKHNIFLDREGSIGFGRDCVGFTKHGSYIMYNPGRYSDDGTFGYNYTFGEEDARLCPPSSVEDAYHKVNCMSVLVHGGDYNEGLRQLYEWVKHLETQGEVYFVEYETGDTGLQALVTGVTNVAVRLK